MVPRIKLRAWLRRGGPIQPWIDALRKFDQCADKGPLLELLKSERSLPKEARWYLADLLQRYNLKRPRGWRTTPAYDRSQGEAKLIWADESVRGSIKKGENVDSAIELAARVYGVNSETLRLFRAGKHSSARRMKKRRSPIERNTRP